MSFASAPAGRAARENASGFRAVHAWPLAAIVLLAVGEQILLGVNTDVSWNITLAERVLDGQRPYIDFIEINPPSSFLLCLIPTLAARLTGLTPEFMVDVLCFAAAGASLALAAAILVESGVIARAAGARLAFVGAAAMLLLPADAFAQREDVALIASLPCLAALAVWASRAQVAPVLSALAGIGAGVAMSIKPHFALFFAPPFIYLIWGIGWRAALRIELIVALVVLTLYWVAVAAYFPAFFERAAPMARDIYLPVRRPLSALLTDPTCILWFVLGALLVLAAWKRLAEPLIAVPALASLGAMAAFVIQGKLWPYQGYPAIALAGLALGPLALEGLADIDAAHDARLRQAIALGCATALALAGFWLSSRVDKPALARAVATIGSHPRLLAIGSDIAIGHPLTREVRGVWVGSLSGLWVTDMSSHALEQGRVGEEARARYEDYLRFDRERLVADIVGQKPDAILIAGDQWLAWTKRHTDVAASLANYHWRATADEVMVYSRNAAAPPLNSGSDRP